MSIPTQITPFTLTNVPVGNHDISVTKDGYVTPSSKSVAVTDGQTVTADFTLVQQVGNISVTSTPTGAKILLDNVDTTQVTPFTLNNVPVGNHDISVTKDGYVTPSGKSVTVADGQTATADFTLVQQVGNISVTSTPTGAKIFLDNVDTTQVTPFTLNNVPVGNHDISVTKDGYVTPSSKSVAVTDGQTATADFTLVQQVGNISVTSTPTGARSPLTMSILHRSHLSP